MCFSWTLETRLQQFYEKIWKWRMSLCFCLIKMICSSQNKNKWCIKNYVSARFASAIRILSSKKIWKYILVQKSLAEKSFMVKVSWNAANNCTIVLLTVVCVNVLNSTFELLLLLTMVFQSCYFEIWKLCCFLMFA